jgi:hypothetical protein
MEEEGDGFEIFELHDFEFKMTDMEEREGSENGSSNDFRRPDAGDSGNRSVRGSILNSPKHYNNFNRAHRFSEMSMLSSVQPYHM